MSDSSVVDADWARALDALEARVRAQAAFVAGDGPLPEGPWAPPPGPLPETCRARVVVLLEQSRDIEREVASRRPRSVPSPVSPYR